MIGLLLVAHDPLASALFRCAIHVYGSQPDDCLALDVNPGQCPPDVATLAQPLLAKLESGAGVLILTDLFGATPANGAAQLVRPGKVECLTGVNLPMLLRALTYRSSGTLDALIERASAGASGGVIRLGANAPQIPQQARAGKEQSNSPEQTADDANARNHHQQ